LVRTSNSLSAAFIMMTTFSVIPTNRAPGVCDRTDGPPRLRNNPAMAKPNLQWIALPHGKLHEVDPNILTVTGRIHMPFTDLPRRMTVVRLSGKRLVVFSAIALDDSSMRVLETYGQPAFLVVPNDKHRLDAKAWKDRYPDVQVVTPAGSRKKVEDVVHVDTSEPDFGDPALQFVTVPGTGRHEAALVIHTPNGVTLVLNDLVGNIRNSSGWGGWFLRMTNFAGDEPQVPRPVKWTMIDDRAALRAQFLRWAELPALRRILVSHGDPIDFQPAEALRDLAQSLAPDQPVPAKVKTA
jgi:hypothetical protein